MARDLLEEDSSSSAVTSDAESSGIRINKEFAKRFEYNKKREELQKLEEKHGKISKKRKRTDDDDDSEPGSGSSDDSSSDSEDEDDLGELATTTLDSEIQATLNAIKSKDPRVYDGKTTFYTTIDSEAQPQKAKADKPMYIQDYHRENLLNGALVDESVPVTHDQEQHRLQLSTIAEMHAAADDGSDEDDEFMATVKREKPSTPAIMLDVEQADKDPEKFLSNFMASRAWVPTEKSSWLPLESDDEEDEQRAEAYETAYNMRFEDPNKSNETLRTHARDMAAKYSVRRDDKNARKKKRETEKEKKVIEKQQLKEEKARLKKLRLEEVQEKVQKIKKAAGLKTSDIRPEDWTRFVDDDWDDFKWEEEMQNRFGESYYAEHDAISDEDDQITGKKKKLKKPKFDDDIDINDIVPDFKEDEGNFSLSDEDEVVEKTNHKKARVEKKRDSKKERRIIEQLVDDQLQLELHNSMSSQLASFRYRETSPQSFGLSSRDILMAEDNQLNEFAGLKKLATYRDPERKRKDQKHLGKKARLRQWRKDTFGHEDGLQESELVPTKNVTEGDEVDGEIVGEVEVTTGKRKRRRPKKNKSST